MPNQNTGNPYVLYKKYRLTRAELVIYNNAVRLIEMQNKYKGLSDKTSMRDLIFQKLIPTWVRQHERELLQLWNEDQIAGRKPEIRVIYPMPDAKER